jgi:hypothetical protein
LDYRTETLSRCDKLLQITVESSPVRRRWLQFSLRSMLVLVVLAAIGFSLWTSNERLKENRRLQEEIKRLKSELGELTIEEGQEGKVHAIGIPTIESFTWKWRVYVPEGRKPRLIASQGMLPTTGRDANIGSSSTSWLEAGEQIITVGLRRDHKDQWTWIIKRNSGGSTFGVSKELAKLIEDGNYGSSTSSVGNSLKVVEPGTQIELLRHQMESNKNPVKKPSKLKDGILIWIDDGPEQQ